MMNFGKKIARGFLTKVNCHIRVELLELASNGSFKQPFIIEWRRGPQKDLSNHYDFKSGSSSVKLSDVMEKVSTFYHKDDSYQAKTCEFKLLSADQKVIQSLAFDMANFVEKQGRVNLHFTKAKVTLTFRIIIEKYDPEKHKNVGNDRMMSQARAQSYMGNGEAEGQPSEEVITLIKQVTYLDEVNYEIQTMNNALQEENDILKTTYKLNFEKITATGEPNDAGHSNEKYNTEINYLVDLLSAQVKKNKEMKAKLDEKEQELQELRQQTKPEISYLVGLLQKKSVEAESARKELEAVRKKSGSEIRYLVDNLQRAKEALDHRTSMGNQEIQYLVGQLQKQTEEVEKGQQQQQLQTKKAQGSIIFLLNQLQAAQNTSSNSDQEKVDQLTKEKAELQKELEELREKLQQQNSSNSPAEGTQAF